MGDRFSAHPAKWFVSLCLLLLFSLCHVKLRSRSKRGSFALLGHKSILLYHVRTRLSRPCALFLPSFPHLWKTPRSPALFRRRMGKFFCPEHRPLPCAENQRPRDFSPGAADKFSGIANKSLLLGEGAPVGTLGRMRGVPKGYEP